MKKEKVTLIQYKGRGTGEQFPNKKLSNFGQTADAWNERRSPGKHVKIRRGEESD
jgi:hypothetical protein